MKCSISGEVSDDFASENYEEGPEKIQRKTLNMKSRRGHPILPSPV
jgi:hypothetical protein